MDTHPTLGMKISGLRCHIEEREQTSEAGKESHRNYECEVPTFVDSVISQAASILGLRPLLSMYWYTIADGCSLLKG